MYKNNVKKYRKERGMRLIDVAEKSGISVGYLCHLENGSRSNPSIEVMENISFALRKRVTEVFFEEWLLYYHKIHILFNN